MEWEATERAEVTKVATLPLRLLVASAVAPSLKVTVPVGVPTPGETAATVAVKVTDWPDTDGLVEEVSVVVVLAALTVCVKVEDVLEVKLASALYTAVMECEPAVKSAVI